jgi:hypothetical protein
MAPGNEAGPRLSTEGTANSSTADFILDAQSDVWAEIATCPPDAVRWAGLGYYAGCLDTRSNVAADLKQAGTAAVAAVRTTVWPLARMADIKSAQGAEIVRCGSPKCERNPSCSACVHVAARRRRGGGDYQGVLAVHSAATR